jgi:hypothetical protein
MKSNTQKITFKKDDVKAHFSGHWRDFYSHFLELQNSNGNESQAVCPFHDDSDPSLSINNDTGLFNCFGCDTKGDAFGFYGKLKGISKTSFPEVLKGICQDFGISGRATGKKGKTERIKSKIVAKYNYVDAEKKILFQVCRIEPGYNGRKKAFFQRRPDGDGGWLKGLDGLVPVFISFALSPQKLHCHNL